MIPLWTYLAIGYLLLVVPLLVVIAVVTFLFAACFPAARPRIRGSILFLGVFSVGNAAFGYWMNSIGANGPILPDLWPAALLATTILFFASALLPRPNESAEHSLSTKSDHSQLP